METAKRLITQANKFDKLDKEYQIIEETLVFVKKNKDKDPAGYKQKVIELTNRKYKIIAKQTELLSEITQANIVERGTLQQRLRKVANLINTGFKYGRNKIIN